MSLKLNLKPGERIVIDRAVITNGNTSCKIFIENKVPILRNKDIMNYQDAKTLCEKVYYIVQMMYLDPLSLESHHRNYWKFVKPILKASPSMLDIVGKISQLIAEENYYGALKRTKEMIKYQDVLLKNAKT